MFKNRKKVFSKFTIIVSFAMMVFFFDVGEVFAWQAQDNRNWDNTDYYTGVEHEEYNGSGGCVYTAHNSYFFNKPSNDVGYIKINFSKAQSEEGNKKTAELQRIYIKEEFQGMKIGQKLLDFAIERAKNNNLKKLWLGVWEHNHKAIRFYEKNKFKKFSEHSFVLGEDVQLDYL